MQILMGFMFAAVLCGMFSRSFDWQGYLVLFTTAACAATIYQFSTGAW